MSLIHLGEMNFTSAISHQELDQFSNHTRKTKQPSGNSPSHDGQVGFHEILQLSFLEQIVKFVYVWMT